MAKSPAWQRKEGKNPKGGLNAKGRASYNAANPCKPGLKAPQPEGGSRKKSFCARMTGMKKKLTSAKTANNQNRGDEIPKDRRVHLTLPCTQGFINPAVWIISRFCARKLLFHPFHAGAKRIPA